MSHTPAPWTAKGIRVKGGNFEFLVTNIVGAPKEEWSANAALIAAAPELLAALDNLMVQIDCRLFDLKSIIPHEALKQARAAIAKAGGAA